MTFPVNVGLENIDSFVSGTIVSSKSSSILNNSSGFKFATPDKAIFSTHCSQ